MNLFWHRAAVISNSNLPVGHKYPFLQTCWREVGPWPHRHLRATTLFADKSKRRKRTKAVRTRTNFTPNERKLQKEGPRRFLRERSHYQFQRRPSKEAPLCRPRTSSTAQINQTNREISLIETRHSAASLFKGERYEPLSFKGEYEGNAESS